MDKEFHNTDRKEIISSVKPDGIILFRRASKFYVLTELIFISLSVHIIIYYAILFALKFNINKTTVGFIVSSVFFFLPIIWEKCINKISFWEMGFKCPESLKIESIIGLLFSIIIVLYNFLLPPGGKINPLSSIVNILFILNCFTISLGEEMFFRSFITGKLHIITGNIYIASIIQSIIFAFPGHHGANFMENLTWRFPIALILSYMYIRKKSILFPVFIHTILNLLFLKLP